MTKITTKGKSTFGPFIIALLSAFLICGIVAYFLVQERDGNKRTDVFMPTENRKEREIQQQTHKKKSESEKNTKRSRPLPKKHADEMSERAEQKTRLQLRSELQRFQKMANKIRQHTHASLDKIESRPLPGGAPKDANDVSKARNISQAGTPPLSAQASTAEIYEMLRKYEEEIQKQNVAFNAAKRALSEGLSFPEVYESLTTGSSLMPSYDNLAAEQFEGLYKATDINVRSTEDLNKYRRLLDQASRQAGLAKSRLEGLFSGGRSINKPGGSENAQAGGDGEGDGGMEVGFDNDGPKTPMAEYSGPKLDPDMVKAQALPGRRISKDAERKGWLYVNTWYMIGPWESYGRDDFAVVHPPEISVDFDAVYTDGKIGEGIAETDAHPLKMIGPRVKLDGVLRWRFMQSESMHNTVPVTAGSATYYAYTELYFDEAESMLVAMGTDDSGRVWINGEEVWQDRGTSWYRIDEHIVTFNFKQGWNKVLLRLENGGGGAAGFSFLLCPKDAIQ